MVYQDVLKKYQFVIHPIWTPRPLTVLLDVSRTVPLKADGETATEAGECGGEIGKNNRSTHSLSRYRYCISFTFQTTCIYNGGKRCTCKFSNGESLIPFWKIWEWFSPYIFYLTNSEMKSLSFRRFTIIYIQCYICLKIYFCFRSLRCCRWVPQFSRRPP